MRFHRAPSRQRATPATTQVGWVVVIAISALLVAGVPGPGHAASSSPAGPSRGAAGLATSSVPRDHSSGGCLGIEIGFLQISPADVTVVGLSSRTFTATAWSTCGSNLTASTQFTWRLSSVEVGSLASSAGPIVVYTACEAPMTGVLHLLGVYEGVNVSANATIHIAGGGGGGAFGIPASSAGNGTTGNPLMRWVGAAVVGILFAGGVAVFLYGPRARRPKPPALGGR